MGVPQGGLAQRDLPPERRRCRANPPCEPPEREGRSMSKGLVSSMMHKEAANISAEALAQLGDGEIAYVRTIRSEDVPVLFPQAPDIEPGLELFALHAADGT